MDEKIDNRRKDDVVLSEVLRVVSGVAERQADYQASAESSRREMKRDIRCLHDGYFENKKIVDASIQEIREAVSDINLALFAKDENNKFEQAGLMNTARNVDKHITVMCNLARWAWKIVLGALALLAAVKAAGML